MTEQPDAAVAQSAHKSNRGTEVGFFNVFVFLCVFFAQCRTGCMQEHYVHYIYTSVQVSLAGSRRKKYNVKIRTLDFSE